MNIQEIRAKREQRAQTLAKNKAIRNPYTHTWNSPFGTVELSENTVERLDATGKNWKIPMCFTGCKEVKDIFDEIDVEAGRAYRAGSSLKVY